MATIKRGIFFTLVLLSVIVLALRLTNQWGASFFQANTKSGVRVLSSPSGGSVYIDDKLVGKTPYEDQSLQPKEYQFKIVQETATASGLFSWQGKVKLSDGTLTVINRDLTKDMASAAGEVITLEKGQGVTVISSPGGSTVEIDNKSYGVTPLSVDIPAGEHTFVLKRSSYLNRSIVAQLTDNYNLVLNVDLALSEADLTEIPAPVITQTQQIVVKDTPNGFLRIREKADLNSREIARVAPGDKLILLEEQGQWDRVRLPDGKEGFASASFLEKF